MGIAPNPGFPEVQGNVFERTEAGNEDRRGPLRFEEGVATDTDVPTDFQKGMQQGSAMAPGRPNRNAPVWQKPAEETLSQRAHVGSASWIEAPTNLGEFAHGSFGRNSEQQFEHKMSAGKSTRQNPTVVND